MIRNLSVKLVVVFLALSGFVGCGSTAPKGVLVSGTVTVDGQPLEDGLIYFKTIETGEIETFNIIKGAYKGNAMPGNRRVEIYSFITKTQNFDGMKAEVKENLIAEKYNMESTLTATVKPEGANTFPFEVRRK